MPIQVAPGIAVDLPGSGIVGPAASWGVLVLAAIVVAAGYGTLAWLALKTAPPRLTPLAPGEVSIGDESPAVVNVLSNDATVTAAGYRATVIDLAARGWLRILPPEDDDDIARVRPTASATTGDTLHPHERLVLQHVMARFTTDRAIPARYLAVDIRASWWKRFGGLVVDECHRLGLTRRRYTPAVIAAPAVIAGIAALLWLRAQTGGDAEIAVVDSIGPRVASFLVLGAEVGLIWRVVGRFVSRAQTLTPQGIEATRRWLGVRRELVAAGLGTMAPSNLQLGDRRLAYATAMCLAEGAAVELPLAREDHYRAWSSVGGEGRLVRVRYPMRIGYGLHPVLALVGGLVGFFGGLWAYRSFDKIANGQALTGLYERFPDQDTLIRYIATAGMFLCAVPILVGLWLALCGAADTLHSNDRTGVVLRARRPAEVVALPRFLRRWFERDRFVLYLAVDDGESGDVVAWRTSERHAVPQGATATVRATTVLGYIRSSEPVGHRLPE